MAAPPSVVERHAAAEPVYGRITALEFIAPLVMFAVFLGLYQYLRVRAEARKDVDRRSNEDGLWQSSGRPR